ncbi:MAG: lysophospholipid acyltransferase family protein [Patescibacteria group bacterium]
MDTVWRAVWHHWFIRTIESVSAHLAVVVLAVALTVVIPVGYVRLLTSDKPDDEIWHDLFQRIFQLYLGAAGIRLEIVGAEFLPPADRPMIVAANHQSLLDGPIMDIATGARHGVAITAPAKHFPWPMSFWVAKVGSIQVGRTKEELAKYRPFGALSGKEAIKRAIMVLKEQQTSLLIFSEGHTEVGYKPLPFQTGAIRIALQSGVPLIPATIRNANGIMPISKRVLRPGTITITFHEPFSLTNDPSLLNDRALVKLWSSQLLCRIAADLPPSYFSPGMALACKEVLQLHPILRAAIKTTKGTVAE